MSARSPSPNQQRRRGGHPPCCLRSKVLNRTASVVSPAEARWEASDAGTRHLGSVPRHSRRPSTMQRSNNQMQNKLWRPVLLDDHRLEDSRKQEGRCPSRGAVMHSHGIETHGVVEPVGWDKFARGPRCSRGQPRAGRRAVNPKGLRTTPEGAWPGSGPCEGALLWGTARHGSSATRRGSSDENEEG